MIGIKSSYSSHVSPGSLDTDLFKINDAKGKLTRNYQMKNALKHVRKTKSNELCIPVTVNQQIISIGHDIKDRCSSSLIFNLVKIM